MTDRETAPSAGSGSTRAQIALATLAMIGSAACWGFATVMSRSLLGRMRPTALLVVQLAASVAALTLLSIKDLGRQRFDARLARASLTGVLEPGLAYLVGLAGLNLTTAGKASVIGATEPIFVVLLVWLLLGQRPSVRLTTCIAVVVVGLILVASPNLGTLGGGSLLGDGLVALGTLFAAGYVVASSRLTHHHEAAPLAAAQQGVGLLVAWVAYATASALGIERQSWNELDAGILGYAMLSGVVQYAAAFWLYLIGLRHLTPSLAALWLTLIPVFGLAGGMIWLGERPAWPVFLGAALILAAILAARREGT